MFNQLKLKIKKALCLCLSTLIFLFSVTILENNQAKAATACQINWNSVDQQIDGFGVSAAGQEATDLYNNFPDPQRSNLLDLLFSQSNGIGLSIFRSMIGDSGTWQGAIPSIEPSEGNWSWTGDEAQIWLMNQAKNRGVDKLFSTVWSPPGWMKSNGSTIGGSIMASKYQAYATYLSNYVGNYKSRFSLDIYGISIANEPDYLPPDYSGCSWNSTQIKDFIGSYLKPTFASNGITAKVIAPESSSWTDSLIGDTLNDTNACSGLDIVAAHAYGGGYSLFSDAQSKGKKIWMTEVCNLGPNDPSIVDGINWAKTIHNHMTVGQVNAWCWWWIYGAGCGNGLTEIDWNNKTYTTDKRLYTIGNFSKFVRPNYYRIDATSNPTTGVYVSVYKDPVTGKFAIVAINENTTISSIDFNLNGFSASAVTPYRTSGSENLMQLSDIPVSGGVLSVSLAARSVTTFTGTGTSTGGQIADPLNDWSKTYSHSANAILDSYTPQYFEGDTSRISRSSNTTETIKYNVNGMTSVNLKVYYCNEGDNIVLQASSTDGNYQTLSVTKDTPVDTGGAWKRVNYSVTSLPANTNYLLIQIPPNSQAEWTPQIGEVTINTSGISAFNQIEAESYSSMSGILTEACSDIGGGQNVGYIENGDYTTYNNIDLGSGASSFQARVASATNGGNIEIRLDSPTGTLVGTCQVSGTGGWQTWTTVNCNVSGASGVHNLYLKFTGGSGALFNINWFKFVSGGTMFEPLNDWSKTYSHSANLTLDGTYPQYTEGDTSRVTRSTNTTETIKYNVNGMTSINLKVYYCNEGDNIVLQASSTDGNYQTLSVTKDTPVDTGGAWKRVNYSVTSLPANTNYLLIQIPPNSQAEWTPQIGEVTITY